jgi:hypothetical protein
MKMFAQQRVATLLCVGVALGLAGCAGSTTMEESWKAPNLPAGDLHNVVTLYISRDGAMRRTAEDSMARKLTHEGVHAVPAYSVLTDADLKDRDQAKAKLAASGYDGVVAIRLVSKETQINAVPPTFDGYWGMGWGWGWGYDLGYMSTETVVRVQTSVYSLAHNRLVWSGLSKTVDPNSVSSAIDSVTSVVATALEKQQVVAPSNAG